MDGDELLRAVQRVAAGAVLARHWPSPGSRHEAALALSGALTRAGWTPSDIEQFVGAVAAAAGDTEIADRLGTVASTALRNTSGNSTTGWTRLAELIDGAVVTAARTWLGAAADTSLAAGAPATQSRGTQRGASHATQLVQLAMDQGIDLFHDAQGAAYLSFTITGHLETWPLPHKAARSYLARLVHQHLGRAVSSQAMTDAIQVLDGEARFAGPERAVAVRVADHKQVLYLDLADADWRVVEIRPGSWQVVGPETVPVRFVRNRSMTPLPLPDPAGTIADLYPLLNVDCEADAQLIVGWLLGGLFPRGSRPVLQLLGEQGSAKSTQARLLRSLIDPNQVPLRSKPRREDELLIAAMHGALLVLDNLSELPVWLSDALCRVATGGGLSKRELYTDAGEVVLDARRPVILTAISDVVTTSDLLDRTITVTLPPIPPDQRRTEAEIERIAEAARPAILGALLTAAADALARLPETTLSHLPRMADFATWVEAAAPSLGWQPGSFLAALETTRRAADEVAIEAEPVGPALLEFMAGQDRWDGTATALLAAVTARVSDAVRREPGWPKGANSLSSKLKRLAPNLGRCGVAVGFARSAGTGQRTIVLTAKETEGDRHGEAHLGSDGIVTPSSQDRHRSSHRRSDQPDSADERGSWSPAVTICDDSDGLFPLLELREEEKENTSLMRGHVENMDSQR